MRRTGFILSVLFLAGFLSAQDTSGVKLSLLTQWLENLPDATVEKIDHHDHFEEAFLVRLKQPVDHNNPDGPGFSQRVFLYHHDFTSPVVFVTEGYSAAFGTNPRAMYELTSYLDANQIIVEHRYFDESVPDPIDWQYLDVEQSANDHHRVVELFKGWYRGKWVNTGISKGGQTAMYHRYFFPEDVDATIGYVCPLNFSVTDSRVFPFLKTVGTESCRQKIYNYQQEMLLNKKEYYPHFIHLAEELGEEYTILSPEKAYELIVMEYEFAFWQWGRWDCDEIPESGIAPKEMVDHLNTVAGINWVSDNGIKGWEPFFYQALTEIGFYGYDLNKFRGLLQHCKGDVFAFDFYCPPGEDCVYDPVPMEKVDHFIRHEADKMMFIYGEYDPWSAPAAQLTGKTDCMLVMKPEGAHNTRIRNLPPEQKSQVLTTLEEWLNVIIDD